MRCTLLLSRGPEGEVLRAAEAGCKNGVRSVRSEFIDRWVPTKIHGALSCVEVTAAVESQTPTLTRKGAEHDPLSAGCKLEDGAGSCGTRIIIRQDIGIARDVYREAFKEKLSGAAKGTDVVTQVKFQHFPNFNVVGLVGCCREKIADAVKGQPSRVI